jgi:hypothetical protein
MSLPRQQHVREHGLAGSYQSSGGGGGGEEEVGTFTLKIDNQSVIQLSRNPIFHDRSKHIDTKYHFIRQCIELDKVKVEHVDTNNQLSNIPTKAPGRDRFIELRTRLDLVRVEEPGQA